MTKCSTECPKGEKATPGTLLPTPWLHSHEKTCSASSSWKDTNRYTQWKGNTLKRGLSCTLVYSKIVRTKSGPQLKLATAGVAASSAGTLRDLRSLRQPKTSMSSHNHRQGDGRKGTEHNQHYKQKTIQSRILGQRTCEDCQREKKKNTHTSPESPDTDCEQIVNVATSVCETQHF